MKSVAFVVMLMGFVSGCSMFRPSIPDKMPISHVETRQPTPTLRAGAGIAVLAPDHPVYMGGFDILRKSEGVHDSPTARALAFEKDGVLGVIVSVDCVGLQRDTVLKIKEKVKDIIDPRWVIIASTHDHASPDTLGMWGLPPLFSGMDDAYMEQLKEGVARAIRSAIASLKPAEVGSAAVTCDTENFYANRRRPGLVDPEVVVLRVREANNGSPIATLFELGCHPEAARRKNKFISADFPDYARAFVEGELGGGVAIYVSGALGAMVTPESKRHTSKDGWDEVARIGWLLAERVRTAVAGIKDYQSSPVLSFWNDVVYVKNHNFLYSIAQFFGIVDRTLYGDGYLETEVNLWQVGDLGIATIPGELEPSLGLRLKQTVKELVKCKHVMPIGLANDELGYLLPESWCEEYELYDYEKTLCVAYDAAERFLRHIQDLALLASYPPPPPTATFIPNRPE